MKQQTIIFCAALFIGGTVIVPALHDAEFGCPHSWCKAPADSHEDHDHGDAPDSDDSNHDSDNCAICLLAATPSITTCGTLLTVVAIETGEQLPLTTRILGSRLSSGAFHARAPPRLSSI